MDSVVRRGKKGIGRWLVAGIVYIKLFAGGLFLGFFLVNALVKSIEKTKYKGH